MLSRWTPEEHCRYGAKISRGCQNCALYVWTFRPKNKKVTYLWWFWKFLPPPPTWHQIFKPIRILVTILISYISRYIHNLYTHKVWRNLKDTFDIPSNPSNPFHPSHPSHQTRRFALCRKGSRWTPEGHCRCLVDFLSTTPPTVWFSKLQLVSVF